MSGYKISKECPICHKVFRSYKSQNRQTCSCKCRHKMHGQKLSQKKPKQCLWCEKIFEVQPSKSNQEYCSLECFHTSNPAKIKPCPICKTSIPDYKNRKTCSISCMALYYSFALQGANNPNWKGGFSSRENSGVSTKIRTIVLQRDNYQCQDCGAKDWNASPSLLHTHHIVHHVNGGTKDPNNLLTLCFVCHWTGKHKYELSKPLQSIASQQSCGSKYLNITS